MTSMSQLQRSAIRRALWSVRFLATVTRIGTPRWYALNEIVCFPKKTGKARIRATGQTVLISSL
jgi:hypothetical protein